MLKFYNINIRIKNELFFIKYQPLIFGLGQFIFVLGFAYAGLYGAKRKIFGPNPSIYSYEKIIGLTTMGIGSIIAIFGGILFLFFFIRVFYSFYSKIFFPKKSNKPND
jgi:heme/copper-type cytochrome/quinol oxidase subunit 1